MLGWLAKWFVGGGFNALADQLADAHRRKLEAKNAHARIEAEKDMARIGAAISAMEHTRGDPFSATSLGRYLIVLPFGIWWAAIFVDSIFSMPWDVLALPPDIMALAVWLVPAIVIGDVGRTILARR
jgi:hypothetical protein